MCLSLGMSRQDAEQEEDGTDCPYVLLKQSDYGRQAVEECQRSGCDEFYCLPLRGVE